jgi:hypothetical protein
VWRHRVSDCCDQRVLISWLSALYWSVRAARVAMTRCRSAMIWKSSIRLGSLRPSGTAGFLLGSHPSLPSCRETPAPQ